MAPKRDCIFTPEVERVVNKTSGANKEPVLLSSTSTAKSKSELTISAIPCRKTTEKTPVTVKKTDLRQKSKVPPLDTPKPKENKALTRSCSVTKSAQKNRKRKPKPAHSGVPLPEKMKKLLEQKILFDRSF